MNNTQALPGTPVGIIKQLSVRTDIKSIVVVYEDINGRIKTLASQQSVGDMAVKKEVLSTVVHDYLFPPGK